MCLVMGKGRAKAVEKRVLDQKLRGSLNVPSGPVYYPTEDEFKNPLEYIYKIKPEAEVYGICKIVPPNSWKPPFGLDLESVKFPTKTQEIHRLQFRPASCNSKTFQLEYNRFLEEHLGKKLKKRVVFEGDDLDLCKLFNAVKRFGGYDKVSKGKKWGEVYQFMSSGEKISKCAKHVLCQLYKEHLHDFENYHNRMNADPAKGYKRNRRCSEFSSSKRRKRNVDEKNPKVENEEVIDQACEQCRSDKHGEVMLLCDSCNKGWHIYCLSPPLKHIPPGNWYCLDCLNTDEDTFGFVPGKCLFLEDFKRIAERAKRKWFGSGSVSRTQIEKKFWDIVEGSGGEVEVMYGNDLDTSVYGSGFPRIGDQRPESVEENVWDEYCGSPWNLNNMPKLKGSMLQAIRHNINGVTVPWLYLGMLFSSFCWHFEDHCFYSVNYLHWGEAKCWYGVPGSAASAFEKVMRKTLPDLFDAQPDLLFQLVTMLSPTVLQENKVPVYTVLQEPGNFVITFPKSFHAGFNFGLNCAEAVNFATADWLPYGGSGAELYRLYRKPAVISHEELLCVVAKGNCYDGEGSKHLKKELLRIYSKEKTWREQLWKSGILRSSPMFLPECPDSVGIEEDITCIICQQFLHLSAIACNCRPSVFACLEHWKHLCECEPTKLRLVYRYTLAELHGMIQEVEKSQETKNSKRPSPGTKRSGAFNKKEGMQVSQARPAEDWLRRASKVLDDVFSSVEYGTLLKEAEQFLWAGSEMDCVRDVAKSLIKAKIWAEAVCDCLSKVERAANNDSQKVHLDFIDELLRVDPVPCFHSGHLKLKDYAEEARQLSEKIDYSLSSSPTITQLELLHSEVSCSPISLRKHEILSKKISSAKMLTERARYYLADTKPPGIELDELFKLTSEILELQVKLPETEGILDLLKKSELARDKCNKVLSGSISLKNVEELLHEFDGFFSINIPELNILRQHHVDALSWISRFNDTMVDVREGKDQRKLIIDLSSLLQDGASLGIQVSEIVEGLPLVEVELKKASCREKARTVYVARMSLDFIEQLLSEAVVLHIEEEKLFVEISGILSTAQCWEERARGILASETQMYDLKDLVRMSVSIDAVLPSLKGIENTIALAETWLQNSEPFLSATSSMASSPGSLLELPVLKDLVSQSKSLSVQLQEPRILESLLLNCERWHCDNHHLLQETEDLLDIVKTDDGRHSTILPKIMDLIARVDFARTSGLSLGLNLDELPELQTASLKLGWCCETILLGSTSPSSELLEVVGKPSLQKILQHLKEGQTLKILPEEYYLGKRLVELKDIGLDWAKRARKVVTDSGALALEDVFKLISEGETLPVHAEEELQSLRARSMLHCVCRKPYNYRSMVSCSQCGEWYHTYCVKLHWRPEAYVCSACCPVAESTPQIDPPRSIEPETPLLNHRRARTLSTDAAVGDLQWKSRKRIKRVARRSPRVHILPWFFTQEPKL